jgi:hypothetical protein
MILPSPTIVGNGLSSQVDRSQGVRPEGIETLESLREQLQQRRFSKRVVKRAVLALSDPGSVESRAARL